MFADGENPLGYFVKYQNDVYIPCSRISEISYSELKNIAIALKNLFFENNRYFFILKDKIVEITKENKEDQKQVLFRLTKSLLTELMNSGYSIRYLYMVMNKLFWNPHQSVDTPDVIDRFFNFFSFKPEKYSVVYKVKESEIKRWISYIDGLQTCKDLPKEIIEKADRSFTKLKNGEAFLVIKRNALDPYAAAMSTTNLIETNLAVYRLYDHSYHYQIHNVTCNIFSENRVYKIGKQIKAVEHTKMPSTRQITESMKVVESAITRIVEGSKYHDFKAGWSAREYHAHSLDSHSEENQLLDLWSIFESVLDISNKHTSDRIIQVCMYLVPLLKQRYFYSLFKQLADDIKNYNEDLFNDLTKEAESESIAVKRICEFCLLEENSDIREETLHNCSDFPLLKERISYYSDVLCSPDKVHAFVEKHAKRVRWQIMRIYRNRNLIIHNGSKMPYLPLLIENLHSYVDDFLSYVIHSMAEGKDVNSMCQELFAKECRWNTVFPRKKGLITREQIEYMLSI